MNRNEAIRTLRRRRNYLCGVVKEQGNTYSGSSYDKAEIAAIGRVLKEIDELSGAKS